MTAIGAPIDLAIIALPATSVVDAVRNCAAAGIPAAIILSTGFADADAEGAARQAELAEVARERKVRVLGPNCMSFMMRLKGLEALRTTYVELNDRAQSATVPLRGILVQKMAAPGVELIVGVVRDPVLGPIAVLGRGGSGVEQMSDRVLLATPFTAEAAQIGT